MSAIDYILSLEKEISELEEQEIKAGEILEDIQDKLREKRIVHRNAVLSQKSLEFGFELSVDMRITCTSEMHEHAKAYYLKVAPNRKTQDLADFHFPLGYSDMRLAALPKDTIYLQGNGNAIHFPPDMVKRAVEGKS